jgi:SAM-dependent methyltransferase
MPFERKDFSRRAHLSELMDGPSTYEEFRACLRDLEKVNQTVFAYSPTLRWLTEFAVKRDVPVHVVDAGCGGGDVLRRIGRWASEHGVQVKLTGIDVNPYATRAAKEFTTGHNGIRWITKSALAYQPDEPVDVVISGLFTHHLQDDAIVQFLGWMEQTAQLGWFVNDLHRKRTPYYGFRTLAWAMRWHSFVRHDGPVSILRSFSRADWEHYCAAAGLCASEVEIEERWPARLCVSRVKR